MCSKFLGIGNLYIFYPPILNLYLIFSVFLINLHYVHLKDSAIVLYHHFQEIVCSKIARYWLNLGIPHECPLLKNNDLVLYYTGLCMLQLILYINYLLLVFLKGDMRFRQSFFSYFVLELRLFKGIMSQIIFSKFAVIR